MTKVFFFAALFGTLCTWAQTGVYTPTGTVAGATLNSSTGNVGIGTTNPAARLHIVDGGFRHGGTGEINVDAPGIVGGRLKILDNGNVGIGVLNPIYKLDIAANGSGVNIAGNTSSFVGAELHLTRTSSLPGVGQGPAIQFNSSANLGHIIQGSDQALQFFHLEPFGWRESMRITAAGNVGIGTSAPAIAKLQIEGASSTDKAVRLENGKFSMSSQSKFEIDAPGVWGGRLLVLENGNVGIGTTDPGSFKLAVNGKIWSQEVNVAMTNPGPDYVFEPDYNLLSLSELETYITQNKHLPEVPSAKEMEKEGLNLKEMNLLLLKKVEELTLHLIEQEKKIQMYHRDNIDLRKEVEAMKKR